MFLKKLFKKKKMFCKRIYNYPLNLYITSIEENPREDLEKKFTLLDNETDKEREWEDGDFEDFVCEVFSVIEKETNYYGILILINKTALNYKTYPFSELIGTITHESIHVVHKVFRKIGQEVDEYNDEMEAYLGSFVSANIVEFMLEEKFINNWFEELRKYKR